MDILAAQHFSELQEAWAWEKETREKQELVIADLEESVRDYETRNTKLLEDLEIEKLRLNEYI